MPSTDLLLAFAATTAVFAFIPGPAMLYAAARTMAGGRRAGLLAVLGIHVGAYVHVVAAAAGLSMLFHTAPIVYMGVKLAGAAYLIWLGLSVFRQRDAEPSLPSRAKTGYRAFMESVTVEVLNPKTVIFFTAFLPQFIDRNADLSITAQFAILGIAVNAIFTLADVVSVFLAELIVTRLETSGPAQRLVRKAGASILIGLGAHLAFKNS